MSRYEVMSLQLVKTEDKPLGMVCAATLKPIMNSVIYYARPVTKLGLRLWAP